MMGFFNVYGKELRISNEGCFHILLVDANFGLYFLIQTLAATGRRMTVRLNAVKLPIGSILEI